MEDIAKWRDLSLGVLDHIRGIREIRNNVFASKGSHQAVQVGSHTVYRDYLFSLEVKVCNPGYSKSTVIKFEIFYAFYFTCSFD